MKNVRKGRIAVFTRKYLTKLLLAAVILTAGFSLRFVALAKYTSYLYDFTGAVASDFCFTSNYLDETGNKLYRISKWDGGTYTLDLELRNFENALRYNKANVNTCYCLDVEVKYSDSGSWTEDTAAKVEITGKTSGIDCIKGKYGSEPDQKTCFLLTGMDDSDPQFKFNRKLGTHNIRVTIKDFSHKDVSNQIIVTAQTIPASMKKDLADDSPEALKNYTGYGVYDVTLSGTFQLDKEAIEQVIEASCSRPDKNNLEMIYTLSCTSLGSGTTPVRIYYDPNYINPDTTMLQKQGGYQVGTGEYADYRYVTITVQSNCITRYSMYSTEYEKDYPAAEAIEKGHIIYEVVTQADGPGGQTETPPDAGT